MRDCKRENAMTAKIVQRRCRALGDPERAMACARFAKTGPVEYAEGDRFLGLNAAMMRGLAKEFRTLAIEHVETLLHSHWHEERSVALLILVLQYPKADEKTKGDIYAF